MHSFILFVFGRVDSCFE